MKFIKNTELKRNYQTRLQKYLIKIRVHERKEKFATLNSDRKNLKLDILGKGN